MAIEIDTSGLDAALKDTIDQQVKKVGTELFTELVQNTPVKTGRLRAGWTLEFSDAGAVIENVVEYCGWVMEYGTRHISPKMLITAAINRITGK